MSLNEGKRKQSVAILNVKNIRTMSIFIQRQTRQFPMASSPLSLEKACISVKPWGVR